MSPKCQTDQKRQDGGLQLQCPPHGRWKGPEWEAHTQPSDQNSCKLLLTEEKTKSSVPSPQSQVQVRAKKLQRDREQ